jgi:hypothetical protein
MSAPLFRWMLVPILCVSWAWADSKYNGPVPAKADVPYLLHADTLVETEVTEARPENRKDGTAYTIPGASSPAKTPLAEPIFIFKSEKIQPERLGLYKLEVRGGNREVVIFTKKRRGDEFRPLHTSLTPLGGNLYRIEVNENLPNGEYAFSPEGSNTSFCFQIY